MLMNERLIFSKIYAEHLVLSKKRLNPLDIRAELTQHLVGFRRSFPQLFALQSADQWYFALDHIFLHKAFLSSFVE